MGRNGVGLYVLAGESPSTRRRVLDPAVYREAAGLLDRHFTISVIDCGSTMDAPVTREALRDLDALIVVSSPWADGASAAAQTMEWLANNDMADLLGTHRRGPQRLRRARGQEDPLGARPAVHQPGPDRHRGAVRPASAAGRRHRRVSARCRPPRGAVPRDRAPLSPDTSRTGQRQALTPGATTDVDVLVGARIPDGSDQILRADGLEILHSHRAAIGAVLRCHP